MRRLLLTLLLLAALLPTPAPAGQVVEGIAKGGEDMWVKRAWPPFLYRYRWTMAVHAVLPERPATPTPVVVLLPGCRQSWRDWLELSGWRELAEAKGAVLLLADFRDDFRDCAWWFDARQRSTEAGRLPAVVAGAVAEARRRFGLPRGTNHVAGLSAGAALAVEMLALYPDLFESGAAMAGVPFGCSARTAETVSEHNGIACLPALFDELPKACACMAGKADLSPAQWAEGLPTGRHWPRLSVWHGTADRTVACRNAVELAEQWSALQGVPPPPVDCRAGGRWTSGDGLEVRLLDGFGHFQPVAANCGSNAPDHFFADAAGTCAARDMAEFFGIR